MAERTVERAGGFTLLEMLLALGLLVFAISTLIGVMSVGVGTRRGAEMRHRASMLADQIVQDLQERVAADAALSTVEARSGEGTVSLEPVVGERIAGFPGMKYTAEFAVDPDDPKVALATVTVSWKEQGEVVGQVFHRIMIRERPFSQRVAAKRNPQ